MVFYSEDCRFSDPFHLVTGKESIENIYTSMLKNLIDPKFVNIKTLSLDSEVAVKWIFSFKNSPTNRVKKIPGVSWLTLDSEGLIINHEDLWDGSEFLNTFFPINIPINWAKSKVKKNL